MFKTVTNHNSTFPLIGVSDTFATNNFSDQKK